VPLLLFYLGEEGRPGRHSGRQAWGSGSRENIGHLADEEIGQMDDASKGFLLYTEVRIESKGGVTKSRASTL